MLLFAYCEYWPPEKSHVLTRYPQINAGHLYVVTHYAQMQATSIFEALDTGDGDLGFIKVVWFLGLFMLFMIGLLKFYDY